jgi:hypothetical protein
MCVGGELVNSSADLLFIIIGRNNMEDKKGWKLIVEWAFTKSTDAKIKISEGASNIRTLTKDDRKFDGEISFGEICTLTVFDIATDKKIDILNNIARSSDCIPQKIIFDQSGLSMTIPSRKQLEMVVNNPPDNVTIGDDQ